MTTKETAYALSLDIPEHSHYEPGRELLIQHLKNQHLGPQVLKEMKADGIILEKLKDEELNQAHWELHSSKI